MSTKEREVEMSEVIFPGGDRFPLEVEMKAPRGQKDSEERIAVGVIKLDLPDVPADKEGQDKMQLGSFNEVLRFIKTLGTFNFIGAVIREMITPACKEASGADGTFDKETGEFKNNVFVEHVIDWFRPPESRKGGKKLKEITNEMAILSIELNKLLQDNIAQPFPTWPTEVQNRMMQIRNEISKNAILMDKKQGIGRKKKTATTAVAA